MVGMPVASEKRIVTGTAGPWNRDALLILAASTEGVKLPSATTPLAWLARKPACLPNSLFMTSIVCSAVEASCAAAGRPMTRASATPATTACPYRETIIRSSLGSDTTRPNGCADEMERIQSEASARSEFGSKQTRTKLQTTTSAKVSVCPRSYRFLTELSCHEPDGRQKEECPRFAGFAFPVLG